MVTIRSFTRFSIAALVFAGSGVLISAPASAENDGRSRYIVTFVKGKNSSTEAARLRAQNIVVPDVLESVISGLIVELPDAAVQALALIPGVASIERDQIATASDTQSGATWGLDRIDQRALPLNQTFSYPSSAGSGVDVYVVDTGVRSTHTEFTGRVSLPGYSSFPDGTEDCDGHGTHVAGTIAGSTWGVAKQATIIPVRVLDCFGSGSYSDIISALDWIAQTRTGPAVVNMSLGGGFSTAMNTAVENLVTSGVTVVVAAGNNGNSLFSSRLACDYSPASAPNAITVGSTTSSDARSSFSNFGTCLDIFAPGSSITSAVSSGDAATAVYSGTSMASPHVAGVAALYLGANPTATPASVTSALKAAATPNVVTSPGTGSPNLLLWSDSGPVAPQPLAVATSTLPNGIVGVSYSANLQASGGNGTYTWTATGLPGGLTLAPNGTITGTPTTVGTSTFEATVTSESISASRTVSLTVAPATSITTTSLPNGTVNVLYSATLLASGGSGSYTWTATGLPGGLTLATNGTISGRPTTSGPFTINATAASGASTDSKSWNITVSPAPVLPSAFNKLSPGNRTTGISRTTTNLTWAASANATSYEVCFSRTNSCTSWINVGNVTSWRTPSLLSRTVYYWQIRASNASGTVLGNGGIWRFTTAR